MPATKKTKTPATPKPKKMTVSATNIARAAERLLSQRLVSTEIDYIQRTLGASSTQQEIDAHVLEVRKLPWASIAAPE